MAGASGLILSTFPSQPESGHDRWATAELDGDTGRKPRSCSQAPLSACPAGLSLSSTEFPPLVFSSLSLNFILFCLCLVSEGGVVGEVLFQKLLGESYI